MYMVNDDAPLGCVYEDENSKTKYCPMLNHDDVPYCQYLEDDEAAIGIDERPVYCPIIKFPSAQPDVPDINVVDINKFIDGLEEIFADIRERHVDDSVCGLCEYDGAYIGQSGAWCNECTGFDRDDCFKLSNECRKKWIDTIAKAQPVQRWIPWDSGKFPEESGYYIVTAHDGSGSRVTFAKYQKRLKRWELTGARAYWRVLAWMPLPEPYKGDV